MRINKRYRPLEERFIIFSEIIEKIIIKLIIVFIVGLVLTQILLTYDDIRRLIVPIEKMEGSFEYIDVIN